MVPSASLVPHFQPAVIVAIMVWAHQLVRSSGPSTVRLKSFWALIWSSQLIGGVSSEAPIAAFLKASVMSGSAWSPAPDGTLPSRTSNQRPTSSSRALIWAMRLRSHRRSRNFGWRHAATFIACAKPHRTTENLPVAMLMAVPRWSEASPIHGARRGPARGRVSRSHRSIMEYERAQGSAAMLSMIALLLPPRLRHRIHTSPSVMGLPLPACGERSTERSEGG